MSPLLLKPEQCLPVFVDVQEKLLPVIEDNELVLDNCIRLAKFAAIMGLPVLACQQQKLGSTVAPLAEAWQNLGGPFEKLSFDCFGQGDFAAAVAASGRDTLIVCGIEAHICVTQTVLSALERGLKAHVIADAVGSRTGTNAMAALDRMDRAGAEISTTEMFIYELLGRAGTDQFRQVLPLVK